MTRFCFVLEKISKTMKCYLRTILLILALIISSSTPVSSQNGTPSTVAPKESTIETSTPKISSTATSPPTTKATSDSTSPPNSETTSEKASITTSETTEGVTEETSTVSAASNSLSTSPKGSSPSIPPTGISPSTPTGTSESTSPTSTSESTSPTSTSESTSPTSTSESTSPTSTSESTSPTSTSESTSPTSTSESTSPTSTSESTSPTSASESITTSSTSVATTPATPSLGVLISETNLLLANDSSRHFVELQVTKNVNIDSVWLVIQNASVNTTEGLLLKHKHINISSFDENRLYLFENDTELSNELKSLDSVLIALYDNEGNAGQLTTKGLHDILLYSSSENIHPDLKERFAINQNLIIDYKKLNISVAVSLSRCSENETANSVAALTSESPRKPNVCNLTLTNALQMKLARKNPPCSHVSSNDFESALMDYVISDVNKNQQCGLAAYMMTDMKVNLTCISDRNEVDVRFTVISAFQDQVTLIKNGYVDFLSQKKLTIKDEEYDLCRTYEDCFGQPAPPASNKDDRIRVTVAVVVSCICVFLVVLLFVILYLRRKRRGVLQFHMTRLDEDDDLAGDMDDFVGNQGPTFRNYR
ncbi:hypothetical protein BsWGS_10502 [Bradybaena similaris]